VNTRTRARVPIDPTYLGSVQDVRGATISVALDEDTLAGLSFIEGAGYRIGQVGSFVRLPMGYLDLFGVVSQVGAGAVPERLAEIEPYGHRWMTVQLVGEGPRGGEFSRGLSQYPTIGDSVHLVIEEDLAAVYGREDAPDVVEVGRLASAEAIPALINLNRVVTRHSAVVGATGAGKSTLVASLLEKLSDPERFPSARILLFDTHGEYAAALKDRALVLRVGGDEDEDEGVLSVPYWAMTSDELLPLTFGQVDDTSRSGIIEKVVELKRQSLERTPRSGVTEETLTADTPVPFSIHGLWFELYEAVNATHTAPGTGQTDATRAYLVDADGNIVERGSALEVIAPRYKQQVPQQIYLSASPLNIRRQLESLAARLRDPRYDFLFRPGGWTPTLDGSTQRDLDALLAQWLGERPLVIIDLSGIPSTVLIELVGALLRIIYDALFWGRYLPEGGRERPLLIVLEEAHSYLGPAGAGDARDAVRRIVKEGRKYGVGVMAVSQRPAEIDPTILSQCGTMFALRLSNATDRGHVTAAVSDHLEGLISMLPVLRTGEAIVIGEAVHLPLRMMTTPATARIPESADPVVSGAARVGWRRQELGDNYARIAEAWRSLTATRPE
jgi:uncharacterized protein